MLEVKKKTENDAVVISLIGRLETTTVSNCEQEIKSSLEGTKDLTIDLSELEYISSAGLRVLLSVQKIMNKQGKMRIRNVKDYVMEVFEITGFSDIMDIE